ncbi:TPA: DUF859 family phage minor structural protein [Streptococcus suis]
MAIIARSIKSMYRNTQTGAIEEGTSDQRFYIYDNVTNEYLAEILAVGGPLGVKEENGKRYPYGFGFTVQVRLMKAIDLRSGGDAFFDITYNGTTKRMPLSKKLYTESSDKNTSYDHSPALGFVDYEEIGILFWGSPAPITTRSLEFNVRTNFFSRTQSAVSIDFGGKIQLEPGYNDYYSGIAYVSPFTAQIGSTVTLSIKNPNSSMRLKYYWNGKYGTIRDASTSSTASWTIPNSFWDDIPNSFNGQGWIILERAYGAVWHVDSHVQFTAEVPASIKPTISSVTLTDDNAKVRAVLASQAFAQILSNITVTVSASGIYGSTINSIRSEIVGKNKVVTTAGGKFGPMNYSGQITIRTTVTDSRGRTSDPLDRVVTVLPYHPPILSFTVSRGGTLRDQLIVTRSVKIAPLTWNSRQNNRLKLNFSTAPKGGSFTANSSSANMDVTTIAELVNSQATLAGTFSSLSSFEVLGTLTDSFVSPVTFKATIGTDSVVVSYDKSGVGINKTRERGAVDVKGDIYANDKPIQQWQMTNNNGTSKNMSVDPDTIVENGFYYLLDGPNRPFNTNGYLTVERYNDDNNFIAQTFKNVYNGTQYIRVRRYGAWGKWVELAKTDHAALNRIDWTSTGVSGVHYKRDGDVVAVRINIAPTTFVSNYALGKIPTTLLPISGAVNYYTVTVLNGDTPQSNNVKVAGDGTMSLTDYVSTNYKLQTVIAWMV